MAVLKPNLVIRKIRIKQSIVTRNILRTSLRAVNGMTCILKFQLEVLVVVKIVLVVEFSAFDNEVVRVRNESNIDEVLLIVASLIEYAVTLLITTTVDDCFAFDTVVVLIILLDKLYKPFWTHIVKFTIC